jgi:hypothetical protein
MIYYFDQLLRDYRASFDLRSGSMERWKPFNDLTIARQWARYAMIAFLVIWFLLWAGYGPDTSVVVLVMFFVTVVAYGIALAIFKDREKDHRTGPGIIKKYHMSMADTVNQVYRLLDKLGTKFEVFGITLTDWPERPRATVFSDDRKAVLITVWKDLRDPYFSVVHMGPYTITKQEHLDKMKHLLDHMMEMA